MAPNELPLVLMSTVISFKTVSLLIYRDALEGYILGLIYNSETVTEISCVNKIPSTLSH